MDDKFEMHSFRSQYRRKWYYFAKVTYILQCYFKSYVCQGICCICDIKRKKIDNQKKTKSWKVIKIKAKEKIPIKISKKKVN